MPDPARPYSPPRAWPRPGGSYSLGHLPVIAIQEPEPAAPEAGMPDAIKFDGDPVLAAFEPDRLPPDPRDARRPGLKWVRAADLLQQGGMALADRLYGPMSRAGEKLHAPVAALGAKAKDVWQARHEPPDRDLGEIDPMAGQSPETGPVISR